MKPPLGPTTDQADDRYQGFSTGFTKTLSNSDETLQMGYKWDQQTPDSKSDMRKPIQLVSTHDSGTKGRWRQTSSHWLSCTQEDCMKIYLAHAKGRRNFCPNEWCKILLNLGSTSRISPHSIGWFFNTQDSLHFTIQKIWIHQSTLWTCISTCIFPGTHDRCPKGLSLCYCLSRWYNHLQQDGRGTPRPH